MARNSTTPPPAASDTVETVETEDQVEIVLRGKSRGAKHGEVRKVDSDKAAKLVRDGLATYPLKADEK